MIDREVLLSFVINLSNNVLNENETKVLKKGLHVAPIQQKNKIPKLCNNFEEVCKCMRIKWAFTNDTSQDCSAVCVFTRKPFRKAWFGHANLQVFLIQV